MTNPHCQVQFDDIHVPGNIVDFRNCRFSRSKVKLNYKLFLVCVNTGKPTTSWIFIYFFFFNSVLPPFQDYFSSYETGQSVSGRKRENPEKKHLAHPQAELGLSHMCPVRGSHPHQTLMDLYVFILFYGSLFT